MSRHRGAHGGRPRPGNPGYQANTRNYNGRHEGGGCLSIALPAASVGLAALGAVLAIVRNLPRY